MAQIGGLPLFSGSFNNYAILNGGGTNTTWFQYKTDEWYGGSMTATPANAIDVDGETDPVPLGIRLQNISGPNDKDIGYLNWFGYWPTTDVSKVVEATSGSDQGWVHILNSTSLTNYVMVWNSTYVLP